MKITLIILPEIKMNKYIKKIKKMTVEELVKEMGNLSSSYQKKVFLFTNFANDKQKFEILKEGNKISKKIQFVLEEAKNRG